MKTFDYGGCVYEISSTQNTHEVRVELSNLYPGRSMHGEREGKQSCVEKKQNKSKQCMHGRRGRIRGLQVSFPGKLGHLEKAAVCLTVLKQHHLLC